MKNKDTDVNQFLDEFASSSGIEAHGGIDSPHWTRRVQRDSFPVRVSFGLSGIHTPVTNATTTSMKRALVRNFGHKYNDFRVQSSASEGRLHLSVQCCRKGEDTTSAFSCGGSESLFSYFLALVLAVLSTIGVCAVIDANFLGSWT